MVWACICGVSWCWMPTTQPRLLVSLTSLSLVEEQRTPVVEHERATCWHGRRPNTKVTASRLKVGGSISASTGSLSTWVWRKYPVMVRRATIEAHIHETSVCPSATHRGTIFPRCINECKDGRSQCWCASSPAGASKAANQCSSCRDLASDAVRCLRYVSVLSSFTPR